MTKINGVRFKEKIQSYYKKDPKIAKRNDANEDTIINGGFITDTKVASDKLGKAFLVYPKKALKGSKNSNFYEFLTMTAIPTITGSATMILLYNLLRRFGEPSFNQIVKGNQVAASVILYAIGKTLGEKIINKGTKKLTGVDLDMTYKLYKRKLPEFYGDKDLISEEFHKVYESVDFPRWDIINKEGMKKGNKFEYYDEIAKKMGYKKPLEAPDQEVQPKIKKVVTKARAASYINKYLWAALGVAIGANYPTSNDAATNLFDTIKLSFKEGVNKKVLWGEYWQHIKGLPLNISRKLIAAGKDFYSGKPTGKMLSDKQIIRNKIFAYSLTGLAAFSTIFGILNTRIGFKNKKEEKVIDTTKPYIEA